MVDYKRLGERIAQTRKSQKLSQEKLAELADITATNLSHIERGKIMSTEQKKGHVISRNSAVSAV